MIGVETRAWVFTLAFIASIVGAGIALAAPAPELALYLLGLATTFGGLAVDTGRATARKRRAESERPTPPQRPSARGMTPVPPEGVNER